MSIVSVAPVFIEVIVTHTGDDLSFMSCIDMLLKEIVKCWPVVHVKVSQSLTDQLAPDRTPGKRGGPIGTPKPQQIEIVRGWLAVQGHMNQEVYAQSRGVAASTLRRWMRELRVEGKL